MSCYCTKSRCGDKMVFKWNFLLKVSCCTGTIFILNTKMPSYQCMKSFQWNTTILRWHIILAQPHQQIWMIIANGTIFYQISSRFLFSVPFPAKHGLSNHFTYRSRKPPFNSSPPSAAYMHQWIRSALVKIKACRLFGTKPLSKPMLDYCQLDP